MTPPTNINKPGINLQALRSILAVAEHKSFRKAAAASGIGQSALSRQVRSLEDSIGVSLFERDKSGVRLTHAGSDFVRSVQKSMGEIDQAISIAGRAGSGQLGRLRIGFYTSLLTGEFKNLLFAYMRKFPDVELQAVEAGGSQLASALRSNTVDISIVTENSNASFHDDGHMNLWQERIVLAMPETNELSSRSVVDWQELKGSQCLLTCRDPGPEILRQIGMKITLPNNRPIVVQHEVGLENLLGLVAIGGGVTLLYESSAGARHPGIVYRELLDGPGPSCIQYAAFWSSKNDNPALRRFISLLQQRYGRRALSAELARCE